MQVVVELLTAMVVWAASFAMAQLGIEVDLKRPEPQRERVIERTRPDMPTKIASECPDAKPAILPVTRSATASTARRA